MSDSCVSCIAPATRSTSLQILIQCPRPSVFNTFDFETCVTPQRLTLFEHLGYQKCSEAEAFCAFYFKMCFAPQRRALFEHLNFQKCSENGVLLTCLLPNVLRATTLFTFSTSQLPKVLRTRQFFTVLTTSKCVSRHNSMQFFIPHLPRWLRSRRFSEPGPQNVRDFPTFSRTCIFFLLTSSSLIFFLLTFSSLTLPTSAFSSVHIVGSFTSKLPSVNH